MATVKMELEKNNMLFPDFKNSNVEVFNEFVSGKGRLIGNCGKRVLLLVDGLGFDLLNEVIGKDPQLSHSFRGAEIKKMNTVFPSFTPTVLTSLESGLSVAEHGIVGSPIPVREYGEMVDIFEKGWGITKRELSIKNAHTLFPLMHNIEKLSENPGFSYLQDEMVYKKNLEIISFKTLGSRFRKYISQRDFFIQLRKLVLNKSNSVVYGYLDKIDHAQHVYSKNSDETKELMKYFLEDVATHLLPMLKEHGYTLLMTSDHGQLSFRKEHISTIYGKDKLLDYMNMPPWGSPRSGFVSIIPGMEEAFEKELEKKFKDRYLLLNSELAIKDGLFGSAKIPDRLRYRFGTHVLLPKENNYITYKYPYEKDREREVFGSHGGLSKEEIEIPLIKFDA